MTAILLALGSSVGYGVSDFLASRVARRIAPVLLVLYSQALQSVVLLVVVVAVRQPYSGGGLGWGAVPGRSGRLGWSPTTRPWPPGRRRSSPPWPQRGRAAPAGRPGRRTAAERVGPGVDRGGEAAGGSVLWVALGVQVSALPTTLAGALRARGRRLGIGDPAVAWPVAWLTVLNLSGDAALAVLGTLVVAAVQAAL